MTQMHLNVYVQKHLTAQMLQIVKLVMILAAFVVDLKKKSVFLVTTTQEWTAMESASA